MNKTIVVTGATGFVGKKLCLELIKKGHDLRIVTRDISKAKQTLALPCSFLEWNGSSELPTEYLEGAHALIHLAGEPIAGNRWTPKVKELIKNSRQQGTSLIMQALARCKQGPNVVIGTSAIGIYGDNGHDLLTEESKPGSGFLSEVCQAWEKSYQYNDEARLCILRVGVVLGYGGALDKMLVPFRMGVGGKLSNGKQWMSWIHIDDLVQLYLYALENSFMSGVFNAVAPEVSTNETFTNTLASTLEKPAIFPVPSMIIKLMFGEMSQVLLSSQKVSSEKVQQTGFCFSFPSLTMALKDLLRPLNIKGAYVFEAFHWIPREVHDVFHYFSEAKNLEKITPPWLNFHITNAPRDGIRKGALIDYRLKVKGIPLKWKTLISTWKPEELFVDEQLKGPYQIWHHTHSFHVVKNGTLMQDRVVYKIPMGPIGDLIREMMIQNDIKNIFKFRAVEINKEFHPISQVQPNDRNTAGLGQRY